MNSMNIFTAFSIVLNVAALIVVAIQTNLTRKALNVARKSIDMSRKVRELEILPRANFIIAVQNDLRRWKKDLENLLNLLKIISQKQNYKDLQNLTHMGLKSPHGLIDRDMYRLSPNWLSVIWISGAQYYYNSKAPQCELWNIYSNNSNPDFLNDMTNLFRDSINGISSLLYYVDDIVPTSYLESPASLSDEAFLSN